MAFGLLAGVVYAFLGTLWHESRVFWFSGAMLAGLFSYLAARLVAELAALGRLEVGILKAREGLLEPTPVEPYAWTSVGRISVIPSKGRRLPISSSPLASPISRYRVLSQL